VRIAGSAATESDDMRRAPSNVSSLMAFAYVAPPAFQQDLRPIFAVRPRCASSRQAMDRDRSGQITAAELQKGLQSGGWQKFSSRSIEVGSTRACPPHRSC
jgi:hypothetical protein